MFFTIIVFVATLLVLVLIHELGHFLVAKKFGIKVEEFGFGIPPRAWGKKFGETLYSINWLPFGGFVKLLGEDDLPEEGKIKESEKSRYFSNRPVGQRILVVVAGVVMNLLLAWLIFYISLGFQGFKTQLPLLLDHHFQGVVQTNESFIVVSGVAPDSPASKSGLKPGDRVVAFNNSPIDNSTDLVNKTSDSKGKEISLTVTNFQGQSSRIVNITPRENPPAGQGPLGVALSQNKLATLEYKTPIQKLFAGPIHSWNITAYSGKIFGNLITKSIQTRNIGPVSQTVAGPVGITNVVNSILTENKNPFLPYLDFVGLLSLNLAIMNILPIPALDGGRFFFLLIEAITRKRVHANFEKWVHTIGMAVLLTLMLLVTFSDIRKLLP